VARIPPVFVSHGAPTLAIEPGAAGAMLAQLAASLPRPRAILVASAHWEAGSAAVSTSAAPPTIHDFGGFPDVLYTLRYAAPGATDVARQAAGLLAAGGLAVQQDPGRGLDHGAWVPLRLMYPQADVPVAQVALVHGAGPAAHLALGRALAPLAEEGVLLLGSGGLTHALARLVWSDPAAPADPSVEEFAAWVERQLAEGDSDALLDYRRRAPYGAWHHPTEEHLMPFYVVLGAAGDPRRLRRLRGGTTYGLLSMDAFVA
jgi:4,5-DOPA dioxygenase extradiol